MFPKTSSQGPLALGWDKKGGEGGGYTFVSMLINKQQLTSKQDQSQTPLKMNNLPNNHCAPYD
jgi:hypothetical protein